MVSEATPAIDDEIAKLRRYVDAHPAGHMRRHQALNRIFMLKYVGAYPPADPIFDCRKLVKRWRIRQQATTNAALLAYLHGIGFVGDGKGAISADERLIINYGDLDHQHPAMRPLVAAVEAAIRKYREGMPAELAERLGVAHLDRFGLRSFAAATRRLGYHYAHMHGGAILVATYYVRVPRPDGAPDGTGAARLYFGFGEKKVIESRDFVIPEEGNLFLFPGHVMHQTTAPETEELRINIGFDILPA
jgi:hypothetical protein